MATVVSNGLIRTNSGWETDIEKREKLEWGLPVLFRNFTLKFLLTTILSTAAGDIGRFWEHLPLISTYYELPIPFDPPISRKFFSFLPHENFRKQYAWFSRFLGVRKSEHCLKMGYRVLHMCQNNSLLVHPPPPPRIIYALST